MRIFLFYLIFESLMKMKKKINLGPLIQSS